MFLLECLVIMKFFLSKLIWSVIFLIKSFFILLLSCIFFYFLSLSLLIVQIGVHFIAHINLQKNLFNLTKKPMENYSTRKKVINIAMPSAEFTTNMVKKLIKLAVILLTANTLLLICYWICLVIGKFEIILNKIS